MSKWVAKKDDAELNALAHIQRGPGRSGVYASNGGGGCAIGALPMQVVTVADGGGGGGGRSRQDARRQAGEARRQIRLAAQEARGDTRMPQKANGSPLDELDVPPNATSFGAGLVSTVEALLRAAAAKAEAEQVRAATKGGSGRKASAKGVGRGAGNDGGAENKDWDEGQYWAGDCGWGGSDRGDWQPREWSAKGGGRGQEFWEGTDAWTCNDWGWDEAAGWADEGSEWDEYIRVQDGVVRVDLGGAELGDADLKALLKHLDAYMRRYTDRSGGHYALYIDLSCNSYITDDGIAQHLVTFLHDWPVCHRLKLYKNAIGDKSLKALRSWVASGYVRELHLSDLTGKVTTDGVYNFLQEIHCKGAYPYTAGGRTKCALWLRLEHNGIQNVEELLKRTQASNFNLCILDRMDFAKIRPGSTNTKPGTKEVPAVNLVLFKTQEKSGSKRRAVGQGPAEVGALTTLKGSEIGAAHGNRIRKESWQEDSNGHYDELEAKALWEVGIEQRQKKAVADVKPLKASDLMMGAASYKQTRTVAGAAPAPSPPKAKPVDFNSSAAFPSLGGPGDVGLGFAEVAGSCGGFNIHAAVAWGAAPSAVFDSKPKAAPKMAAPKAAPIMGLPPPPAASIQAPIGSPPPSRLAALVGLPPAAPPKAAPSTLPPAPTHPPLQPPTAPPSAAPKMAPPSVPPTVAPATKELGGDEAEGGASEVVWRPLSFAEKSLLKVKKKLRDIEKIEEALNAGERVESNQIAKVQKKASLEQELLILERRSAEQGGRTLLEIERAEKMRREQEDRDGGIHALVDERNEDQEQNHEETNIVDNAEARLGQTEHEGDVEKVEDELLHRPNSQASASQPASVRAKANLVFVPPIHEEALWRPLSFAEKNLLKVKKKLRDIEKIEDALAAGEKVESNQKAKVQKKQGLEQELLMLEHRSVEQGGRTLLELERAERWRKEQDEKEKAVIKIQKIARGNQVRRNIDDIIARLVEEATLELEGQADEGEEAEGAVALEETPQVAIEVEADDARNETVAGDPAQEVAPKDSEKEAASAREEALPAPPAPAFERVLPIVLPPLKVSEYEGTPLKELEWMYRTPVGAVHGPFENTKMRTWHTHGYFVGTLEVKLMKYNEFYPLESLFPRNFEEAFLTHPEHPEVEKTITIPQAPIAAPVMAPVLPLQANSNGIPHQDLAGVAEEIPKSRFPTPPQRAPTPQYEAPFKQPQVHQPQQPLQQAPLHTPSKELDTWEFESDPWAPHPRLHQPQQHSQQEAPLQAPSQALDPWLSVLSVSDPWIPHPPPQQVTRPAPPSTLSTELKGCPPSSPPQQASSAPPLPSAEQTDTSQGLPSSAPTVSSFQQVVAMAPETTPQHPPSQPPTKSPPHPFEELSDEPKSQQQPTRNGKDTKVINDNPLPCSAQQKDGDTKRELPPMPKTMAPGPPPPVPTSADFPAFAPLKTTAEPPPLPKKENSQESAVAAFLKRLAKPDALLEQMKEAEAREKEEEAKRKAEEQMKQEQLQKREPEDKDRELKRKQEREVGPEPLEDAWADEPEQGPRPVVTSLRSGLVVAEEEKGSTSPSAAEAGAQLPVWPKLRPQVPSKSLGLPPAGTVTKREDSQSGVVSQSKHALAKSPKVAAAPPPREGASVAKASAVKEKGLQSQPVHEQEIAKEVSSDKKEEAVRERDRKKEPEKEEDENERIQDVAPLDHKFVGLIIGKAGETIKNFKKQSGASIEIDQNLPDGMPRVVIFRGTRKQVKDAKRLIENLVQRAQEDERNKERAVAPAVGTGMGILGRGPAGDERPVAKAAAGSGATAGSAGGTTLEGALPPWRRAKGEEEPLPAGAPSSLSPAIPGAASGSRQPSDRAIAEPRAVRSNAAGNTGVATGGGARTALWVGRKESVPEAAPSGSLTGSLTGSLSGALSMRPAWTRPGSTAKLGEESAGDLNWDKTAWEESKFSRTTLVVARYIVLKSEADAPEAMKTMTVGVRPKYKAEKKGEKEEDPASEEPIQHGEAIASVGSKVRAEQSVSDKSAPEPPNQASSGGGGGLVERERTAPLYENLPGDSKDMLKLKKKLREIQKIEDALANGEVLEPNQLEKITKKEGYLEELATLESIVRSTVA